MDLGHVGLALAAVGGICIAWFMGRRTQAPQRTIFAADMQGVAKATEREKQEALSHALARRQEFLAVDDPNAGWLRFLEEAPVAVALLSTTSEIVRHNHAFAEIVGDRETLKKHPRLVDLLHEDAKEKVTALFGAVISGKAGEDAKKPLDVLLNNAQATRVSLYVSKIDMVDGKNSGFIVHLIDITEQKNLELRFVHSQKMQAVGQLAGGIAHDFNNLLTAMIGFCDLLLMRHPAGDPSFADIMQVKQNANRAANLVRQLLAFSRKQTLQPQRLNITDILADLTHLIRRLIGENIEFNMIHGRDVGAVMVDQGQFEQVIINLAVNARDAMKQGGVLTIQTSHAVIPESGAQLAPRFVPADPDEVLQPGAYVRIDMMDTGCGMSQEIVRKIFEPFFSTKEVGSGTGLGLSTVYGIVKQTGGYIYVASEEGEGTTFSIFLKRAEGQVEETQEEQTSEESEKSTADLTGSGTVLLVEDEAPVRIFSARALRNKGYQVLEADCGEAALKVMKEHGDKIQVIITDVVMPGINGPTLVEEVLRTRKNIKVIFISGYGEDAFMKTYGSEREFNFLPKPYTLKQLASKVKEVFGG